MKRQTFAVFALVIAALTTGAGQPASPPPPPVQPPAAEPQQPPVTFRAEVNYVEVDARVVDANGRFVTGLSQGDFQILEDGRPQKISVFSLVNIPVERAARPLFASKPIEPDVQTNLQTLDGRLYVIVLDDLHTHPLRSTLVKRAARQFIERYVGANDLAAVVHTSGRTEGAQDFTSNQRLLLRAVDVFLGRKLRSSLMNRLEEEARTRGMRQPGDPIRDADDMERGFQARNALDAIKNIAEFMEGVRGRRKAVLFFSEGIDYDINDPFANREATTVMDATREAIAAATRGNVSLYAIDPRGLTTGLEDAIEIQSFPEDPSLGLTPSGLMNEVRLGQDSLRVLAEQTGGVAAVNSNDFTGAFQRVVEDNSSYYVLGYYPSNDRRDGRFRKIDVRVNRPGVTVRARRGYVAPRGRAPETKLAGPNEASPELREAMSSPVPLASLALATTVAVFKGPSPNGSAVISTLIGGRDLPLAEKNGAFHNDVEIAFMAVDGKGKIHSGDRNTLNMTLKPDTLQRVRLGGFRVITSMDLPPERYQLRVAVREANSQRTGSVLYDFEVPNFSKEALSMSSIALTSMSSGMSPTARPKDPLAKLLPGPLTSYREFTSADELAVFTEIYDSEKLPHKVDVRLTVKAEGGQTVFQTSEERESSELKGNPGGYGFTTKIPLRDFAPAMYVLRVEATSLIGDRVSAAREVVFTVVPSAGGPTAARSEPAQKPDAQKPAPPTPVDTSRVRESKPAAPPAAPGGARIEPVPPPGSPGAAPFTPVPSTGAPVAMTTVASDSMSAIDRPREVVARTAAEWESLWRAHAPGRSMPAVDFAKNMLVAVFLGSRPTSGYSVQITGVRRDGDTLVVQWAEIAPAPGQMAAQVMTAPSHVVQVPQHKGPVRFQRVDRPGA